MMRLKDVAKELDVSESWLDKAIKVGAIAVIWLGGVRRISDEEMNRIRKEGVKIE